MYTCLLHAMSLSLSYLNYCRTEYCQIFHPWFSCLSHFWLCNALTAVHSHCKALSIILNEARTFNQNEMLAHILISYIYIHCKDGRLLYLMTGLLLFTSFHSSVSFTLFLWGTFNCRWYNQSIFHMAFYLLDLWPTSHICLKFSAVTRL